MPMYEFECLSCGHHFDRIQKHNDPSPPCPHKPAPELVKSVGSEEIVGEVEAAACGGETKRLISGGAFHLKGGGWASDGYG